MKNLPPFPDQPKIKAKTEGNKVQAIIENWEFKEGPDMIFQDGKWWIRK